MKSFTLLAFYSFMVLLSLASCLDYNFKGTELERNDPTVTRIVVEERGTDPPLQPSLLPPLFPPWQPWEAPPAPPMYWQRMVCKAQKLLLGMTLDPEHAIRFVTPLTTPWTGDFMVHLSTWGYRDDSDATHRRFECEFGAYDLSRAFADLGIGLTSHWQGGPNRCFMVLHRDGPTVQRLPNNELPELENQYYTVNGRRYRVTDAHFTIGVNVESRAIFFISLASPATEARMLWDVDYPPKDELPLLRSPSDFAWGFWSRMSPGNLGTINKFFTLTIVNDATQAIIRLCLVNLGKPAKLEEVPRWPGMTFTSDQEDYQALLASPVSAATAYFLIQHKAQLGSNKYISKITVFRSDGSDTLPNMLYWVEDAPPSPPPPPDTSLDRHPDFAVGNFESRLLERDVGWTNVVREHVVWIKAQ